jgi:hypothetical protein
MGNCAAIGAATAGRNADVLLARVLSLFEPGALGSGELYFGTNTSVLDNFFWCVCAGRGVASFGLIDQPPKCVLLDNVLFRRGFRHPRTGAGATLRERTTDGVASSFFQNVD